MRESGQAFSFETMAVILAGCVVSECERESADVIGSSDISVGSVEG